MKNIEMFFFSLNHKRLQIWTDTTLSSYVTWSATLQLNWHVYVNENVLHPAVPSILTRWQTLENDSKDVCSQVLRSKTLAKKLFSWLFSFMFFYEYLWFLGYDLKKWWKMDMIFYVFLKIYVLFFWWLFYDFVYDFLWFFVFSLVFYVFLMIFYDSLKMIFLMKFYDIFMKIYVFYEKYDFLWFF